MARLLPFTIGLIALTSCARSRVDAGLGAECRDGDSCYRQAQALVKVNYQEKAAKSDSAERSAERAANAVRLFQRGCDLGSGMSCGALGDWLADGGLAPVDLPRAARLQERGCALKEFRACDSLAHLYRDGRGVPKDPTLQAKYRKLACDLADPPMAKATFCNDN